MDDYSLRWLDPRRPTVAEDATGTFAYDMNNDGVAIGWCYFKPPPVNLASPAPPERYEGKGTICWYPDRTEFGKLPFWITSLNDFGDFVGYNESPLITDGFVHTGGTTLNLRSKFGVAHIYPVCINNRGVVTGTFSKTAYRSGSRAFVYNAVTEGGPPTDFDLLGDGSVAAGWEINEKDHVLGHRGSFYAPLAREYRMWGGEPSVPDQSWLHVDGEVIELGEVVGFGLNDDDVVVGSRRINPGGPPTAFALNANAGALEFEDLGVLPDLGHDSSWASDINNSGDIVGGSRQNGQNARPFLLPKGGTMIDLNTLIPPELEWQLSSAVRINDHGQILCWGWARHLGPLGADPGPLACILTPELHIPFVKPDRLIGDRYSLTGGTGWVVFRPGTRPVPINPNELWGGQKWDQLSPAKQEVVLDLAVENIGQNASDPDDRAQIRNAVESYLNRTTAPWDVLQAPEAGPGG